jgi:hypothetical protein
LEPFILIEDIATAIYSKKVILPYVDISRLEGK